MDDHGLPPTALRLIAGHLEELARQYRARAATLDHWADTQAHAKQRLDAAYSSPEVFRQYLAQGLAYEQALDATAAATGLPVETIEYHWRRQNRPDPKAEAEARAIEVLRLAAKGWSNAAIAEKLSLHPNSVSRIISRKIRR